MADATGHEEPQPAQPALAKKVKGHVTLEPSDLDALAALCRQRGTASRGALLMDRDRTVDSAFLVERGWAIRFSILPNGRRQILAFVLPGDTFGLAGMILGHPTESVAAITPIIVARLTLDALRAAMRDHPVLNRAMLWSVAQEYALLCDRLTSLGRRAAFERVARALLELTTRWNIVRDATESPTLPLTQPMIGDALGLSTVHVNRTLQRLRASGLISVERGPIRVKDPAELMRAAKIKPGDPLHPLLVGASGAAPS